MPRSLSAAIKAVLDSQYAETHDVVEITLPQMPGDAEAKTFYFASSALIIGVTQYLPLIRSIGAVKFSLGKAADGAELSLANEDSAYSGLLSEPDRTLNGSRVVIKRAFLVDEDPRTFETDTIFVGYVNDWRIDQQFIRLSLVSDMNRRGAKVAWRQLTQRCIWVFKSPECGHVDGQGGTLDSPIPSRPGLSMFGYCDKVFDSPYGCLGHANQWRYGGVPPLTPTARALNQDITPFEGYDPVRDGFDRDFERGRGFSNLPMMLP